MNRDDRIMLVAVIMGLLSVVSSEIYILTTFSNFIGSLSRLDQVAVGAGIPTLIGCSIIIIVGTILDKRLKKNSS